MIKLVFFVPAIEKEFVKTALFKAGAGRIGEYDCCSFEIKGTGQFRPLKGSKPHLGSLNQLERVEEYRVEMILEENVFETVKTALLSAHPYETPAYEFYSILK